MRDRRGSSIGLAALLLLTIGCSDSTAPEPSITPQALQRISGDSQRVLRGDDVREPLRVRVLGSDGQPLPGATVEWTVTQGQATLSRTTSLTNSTCHSEARVTNVATVGTVVVRARAQGGTADTVSVTGLFSITALDPCLISSVPSYTLGNLATGVIRPLDCDLGDGSLQDFYIFRLTSQQAVTMQVRSDSFVPAVNLWTSDDALWRGGVYNPDGPAAPMKAILAPGAYFVAASSFDVGETGPYELSIVAASESAGCELVFVVRGLVTAQQLASTDCPQAGGDPSAPRYQDSFWLALYTGERMTVTHSSTQFQPRLRLQRRSGTVVAETEGNATGMAMIDFTADETNLYRIIASSSLAQQSGAYVLNISYTPGVAASAAGSPGDRSLSLTRKIVGFHGRPVGDFHSLCGTSVFGGSARCLTVVRRRHSLTAPWHRPTSPHARP
jgi:hypothetical protein